MATFYSSKTANNAIAYVNGSVYTVDEAQPWASAFIVAPTGTFEFVGQTEHVLGIARTRNLIIYDLGGRFIMPGIHDAHGHLAMAGECKLFRVNIGVDADQNSLARRLKDRLCVCDYANVSGDWVVANYYQPQLFPDGKPDRKYIDELWPDTPVLVRETSHHKVLLNTVGLQRIGIDPLTAQDPEGGVYARRDDGSLTGELMELAMRDVWLSLPIPPLITARKSLISSIRICHRYGITSVQEASANTLYLHAARELEEDKQLNLDIHTHIICGNEFFAVEPTASLEALLDVAEAFRSPHVDTRFVKFWLDGSPIEPGFTASVLDEHGHPDKKMLQFDDATLLKAVTKYDAMGMTCKMHASGEGSVRQALNIYEKVREGNPNGPLHEIAHSNAIHPDDFARLSRLRITAEMSPAVFHLVDYWDSRGTLRYEFDQVHAAGGLCTIGSDWPVTETPNLFPAVAGIVERLTVESPNYHGSRGTGSEQRSAKEVGGEIACRMLTMGGAEAVGKQDVTGSITQGKKANFIMVDRDLSKGEFDGAKVLKTWFEGEVVWDHEGDHRVSI